MSLRVLLPQCRYDLNFSVQVRFNITGTICLWYDVDTKECNIKEISSMDWPPSPLRHETRAMIEARAKILGWYLL